METIKLHEFSVPTAMVPLGRGKQFEVRGLTADDLTFLIASHLPEISKAVKLYQESRADILVTGNMSQMIMTLARDFPALVTEVISAAIDSTDDESRAVIRKLPIITQLSALNEITKLTMEDVGGLKNLLAEMRARMGELASDGANKA